jgi:hypothetical protein
MLTEYVLALGVIMIAAVLLTQLLATAAHQRRLGNERRLALEEAANRLERAALLPWDQLTAENIQRRQLQTAVQQALADAKLTAAVTDEQAGPVAARRIDVSLTWRNSAGVTVEPVTLSAWRFQDKEAQP